MKKIQTIIAPSILSADFACLADECLRIQKDGADWFHVDVMVQIHFVPNLTIGPPIVKCLKKRVNGFYDCHCMISEPYKWVEDFAKAGADQMTYHYEADVGESHEALINKIHSLGMKAGLALKPKTQIDDKLILLLDKNILDIILVMTVEPGFGGQKFMEDMIPKIELLRKRYSTINIQVDGGIAIETIEQVAKAGANVIVSGSGVFNHKDPKYAMQFMRDVVNKYI